MKRAETDCFVWLNRPTVGTYSRGVVSWLVGKDGTHQLSGPPGEGKDAAIAAFDLRTKPPRPVVIELMRSSGAPLRACIDALSRHDCDFNEAAGYLSKRGLA